MNQPVLSFEGVKSKQDMTQKKAMSIVWARMPEGKFDVYEYERIVNNLLRNYGMRISGSGFSAQMRNLRKSCDINYHCNRSDDTYKKIK